MSSKGDHGLRMAKLLFRARLMFPMLPTHSLIQVNGKHLRSESHRKRTCFKLFNIIVGATDMFLARLLSWLLSLSTFAVFQIFLFFKAGRVQHRIDVHGAVMILADDFTGRVTGPKAD